MYYLINRTLSEPIITLTTSNSMIHTHNTQNRYNPHIKIRRTNIAAKRLRHKGPITWYKIPDKIKAAKTMNAFFKRIKKNII